MDCGAGQSSVERSIRLAEQRATKELADLWEDVLNTPEWYHSRARIASQSSDALARSNSPQGYVLEPIEGDAAAALQVLKDLLKGHSKSCQESRERIIGALKKEMTPSREEVLDDMRELIANYLPGDQPEPQ